MPFDMMPPQASPIDVFRKRREDAALLWSAVPTDSFDMKYWRCGTTACALGWLGLKHFDGWRFEYLAPIVSGHLSPITSAAAYFGISNVEAQNCFGPHRGEIPLYGGKRLRMVTANDVARVLLALPYTVPSTAMSVAGVRMP